MNRTQIDSTGASRGNLRSYATGFFLSIVLTVIAFAVVMSGILSRQATIVSIGVAAVAQVLVHLHYFLHLDTSSAARWNVLALLFTLLIMTFFVGGTLWIMFSLDYRMM